MSGSILTSLRIIAALVASIAMLRAVAADPLQEAESQPSPLDCVINPSVVADLGSGVPGIINDVLVDRADFVKAGEVVARLDSGVEVAARDLAQVKAQKDAEIQLRRVNAAFGKRKYERSEDLFRRKVISTNDIDETKTEAQLARIQLRQALDNKELATLELARAEQVLKRRTIKSPIDGVVMERFKTIGEYVDEQPVLRVAQLDPLYVEVFVPVEQLGDIRPGMRAEVWSESVDGEGWEAEVNRVDKVADVASGTYGVRLVLPNPDYQVPAGLRCLLTFHEAPPLTEPIAERADDAAVPVDVGEEKAVALPPPAEPPGNTEPVCLRAGPFDDENVARRVAGELETHGLATRIQPYQANEPLGYRVVSDRFDSRGDAETFVARLKQAGVRDFLLAPGRKGPVRVALGLYRDEQAAQRRVQDLQALGFTARLVPWKRSVQRFAVAISGQADEAIAERLADLPAAVDDSDLAPSACDRLAGG